MRPPLQVEFTGNQVHVLVRGHGSWELLKELFGRKPYWSLRDRAWTTTERRASDLIAAAQARGWRVMVSGPSASDAVAAGSSGVLDAAEAEQEVLW